MRQFIRHTKILEEELLQKYNHRYITYLSVCHLQLAGGSPLPSTPELNEEASGRSASPDVRTSCQGQCLLCVCDFQPK